MGDGQKLNAFDDCDGGVPSGLLFGVELLGRAIVFAGARAEYIGLRGYVWP